VACGYHGSEFRGKDLGILGLKSEFSGRGVFSLGFRF
jgi:hypothetical protein